MIATDPGLPHGYDVQVCACEGGAYVGARKAGTPDRCEVCGFMTPGQHDHLIRQAKADALEDFAHNHVLNQSPGRMAEDLLEHAAAIRAGRP